MVSCFLTLSPAALSPTPFKSNLPPPLTVREHFLACTAAPSPSASVSPALSESVFVVPSATVRMRKESVCLNTIAALVCSAVVEISAPFKIRRTVPSTPSTLIQPFNFPVRT